MRILELENTANWSTIGAFNLSSPTELKWDESLPAQFTSETNSNVFMVRAATTDPDFENTCGWLDIQHKVSVDGIITFVSERRWRRVFKNTIQLYLLDAINTTKKIKWITANGIGLVDCKIWAYHGIDNNEILFELEELNLLLTSLESKINAIKVKTDTL